MRGHDVDLCNTVNRTKWLDQGLSSKDWN